VTRPVALELSVLLCAYAGARRGENPHGPPEGCSDKEVGLMTSSRGGRYV
jgi:hypothetical protein